LIGTNTAECHPIVLTVSRSTTRRTVKLIVVDPRYTPTAEAADLHLAIRPGTDIDLLNCSPDPALGLRQLEFIENARPTFQHLRK